MTGCESYNLIHLSGNAMRVSSNLTIKSFATFPRASEPIDDIAAGTNTGTTLAKHGFSLSYTSILLQRESSSIEFSAQTKILSDLASSYAFSSSIRR